MGHLELGTHRPAAGLVDALQVGDTEEDMTPFTGANPHFAGAMRAYQFVAAHRHLLLGTLAACKTP